MQQGAPRIARRSPTNQAPGAPVRQLAHCLCVNSASNAVRPSLRWRYHNSYDSIATSIARSTVSITGSAGEPRISMESQWS